MDGTPHYRGGCTSPPSFIRRGRFDFLPSASTFFRCSIAHTSSSSKYESRADRFEWTRYLVRITSTTFCYLFHTRDKSLLFATETVHSSACFILLQRKSLRPCVRACAHVLVINMSLILLIPGDGMTACIIFFRFRSELRVEQRNVLMIMMPSQDFLSWQGVRTYQHDRSLALIDGYPTAFCELEIISTNRSLSIANRSLRIWIDDLYSYVQ